MYADAKEAKHNRWVSRRHETHESREGAMIHRLGRTKSPHRRQWRALVRFRFQLKAWENMLEATPQKFSDDRAWIKKKIKKCQDNIEALKAKGHI